MSKKWTLMIYMAGDNNLTFEMTQTLDQIREASRIGPNFDLFVYFDGASKNIPTFYCDFSTPNGAKFSPSYRVSGKLIDGPRDSSEDSARTSSIINFVDWCVQKTAPHAREHRRYALILSGHSFSFLNWGLFKDESANHHMSHSQLRVVLNRITCAEEQLHDVGERIVIGRKLDLLGFDSCDMGSVEISSQFKDFANVLVASQGKVPKTGWNYSDLMINHLQIEPDCGAERLATGIVERYIRRHSRLALSNLSVDIAAWNLNNLSGLEESLYRLSIALFHCLNSQTTVVQQLKRLLIYVHWKCQSFTFKQQIDIGDFCHLLVKEIDLLEDELSQHTFKHFNDLRSSSASVLTELRTCILLSGFVGSDSQFSHGASMFFPWSWSSYRAAQDDYEALDFTTTSSAGKKWNEFLKKFLKEATMRKSLSAVNGGYEEPVGSQSLVFEPYPDLCLSSLTDSTVIPTDNDSHLPNGGKRPPNDSKRPPDGDRRLTIETKRPPDGDRGLSSDGGNNMAKFISLFSEWKNTESNWNLAGFKTGNIDLLEEIKLIPEVDTP
jgi:hypothetical protein